MGRIEGLSEIIEEHKKTGKQNRTESDRSCFSFFKISFQHQNILMAVPGHVFDDTAAEQEAFSELGVIKAAVNDFLNFMDFV